MVTEVVVDTGLVLTVKVALVALPGTVTLAGTLATPGLLLDRLTTAPPLGAGALSVTVPVEELPPVTLVGLRLSAESVGGAGVREGEADRVVPSEERKSVVEGTGVGVRVRVALVALPG